MTPAKRKRLIKTYGPCPAGYTFEDLERFLDLLYGLYDDTVELRRMTVCNPFDRSETPQRMRLASRCLNEYRSFCLHLDLKDLLEGDNTEHGLLRLLLALLSEPSQRSHHYRSGSTR